MPVQVFQPRLEHVAGCMHSILGIKGVLDIEIPVIDECPSHYSYRDPTSIPRHDETSVFYRTIRRDEHCSDCGESDANLGYL